MLHKAIKDKSVKNSIDIFFEVIISKVEFGLCRSITSFNHFKQNLVTSLPTISLKVL